MKSKARNKINVQIQNKIASDINKQRRDNKQSKTVSQRGLSTDEELVLELKKIAFAGKRAGNNDTFINTGVTNIENQTLK